MVVTARRADSPATHGRCGEARGPDVPVLPRAGGGKAARRGDRRQDAARRADRQRPRPSALSGARRARPQRWCAPSLTTGAAFPRHHRQAPVARRLEQPLPPNATALHAHPACRGGADPVPRYSGQRRRRSRRHPCRSPIRARRASPRSSTACCARSPAAKDDELEPMLATTMDAPAWFAERLTAAYGEDKAKAILAGAPRRGARRFHR